MGPCIKKTHVEKFPLKGTLCPQRLGVLGEDEFAS